MSIWGRLFRRKQPSDFTGTPPLRRIQSYSAQTGYVYQYNFEGARQAENGKEYRFRVRANAREYKNVFVRVPEHLVREWGTAHSRELVDTEQYGIAKMLLFQHFDEATDGGALGSSIVLTRADLDRISAELDLD